MISVLNIILTAMIAILMGILGAYFTKWEQNIYQKYFQYILPPIAMAGVFFLFIDQATSQALFFILIIGLSWIYSTKFLWNKK
jgi:ABC-type proline/glycine betaine transport system permease subunit